MWSCIVLLKYNTKDEIGIDKIAIQIPEEYWIKIIEWLQIIDSSFNYEIVFFPKQKYTNIDWWVYSF